MPWQPDKNDVTRDIASWRTATWSAETMATVPAAFAALREGHDAESVTRLAVSAGGLRVKPVIIPTLACSAFALADSRRALIGMTEGIISRLSREQAQALADHRRGRRLHHQRMGYAPVRQVALDRVRARHQEVEVRQCSQNPADQRGSTRDSAPAKHSDADGGTERELR